jgi:ketosteroid isomerase-like protein
MRQTARGFLLWSLLPACSAPAPGDSADSVAAPAAARVDSATAVREGAQLEHDWAAAVSRGDLATIEGFVADDFLFLQRDGTVATRPQFIDGLRPEFERRRADSAPRTETVDTVHARAHGDVVVLVGTYSTTAVVKGRRETAREGFTDVARRRNGRWQFISMTNLPIDTAPPAPRKD